MNSGDVLDVLRSIEKFDKDIKPKAFIENGFVKLNGMILKENIKCNVGDILHVRKDKNPCDWEHYTIISN